MLFETIISTAIWSFSSFVNAITGLGAGAIAIPLCSLFIAPKQAIVVGMLASAFIAGGTLLIYRRYINWKLCLYFWSFSIPGAFLGVWLLKIIPIAYLQLFLSIAIVIHLLVQNFASALVAALKPHKFYTPLFGLLSGFVCAAVGVNAPVMIIYTMLMKLDKDQARGFFATAIISLMFNSILYVADGLVTMSDCLLTAIIIPFALLSIYLARPLAYRINVRIFNLLITLLLIFAVISLLAKSIPVLIA